MKKTIAALLLLSVLAGLCCCKKLDEKKVPALSAAGTPAGLVNSLSTPSAEAPLHGRNIYGKMVLYQETVYYDYAPATSENLDNTEIHAVALGQGEAPVCILQDARIDSLTGSLLIAYRYKEGRYYGLNLEKGDVYKRQVDRNSLEMLGYAMLVLHALMSHQRQNGTFRQDKSAFVQQLMAYVEQHYTEDLSLESTARYFGYEKSYFCRKFRRHFNQSFID